MPESVAKGADGADYEQCLIDLKDKGDARYGICMKSYKLHHKKNENGEWVRKEGHLKDKKGVWIVKKSESNFAGFDDWIPVFAGGMQKDSQGNDHDGDKLIDKAIENFDPEYHEPPAVIGHPKDNSPAYGSVSELKKELTKVKGLGKVSVLFAKFKDVVPEFAQAVKDGIFKKRSASFYGDGRLRHVGFLGGMPPAVKGLANIKFVENDDSFSFNEQEIEFMDGWIFKTLGRMFQKFREYIIETKGVEEADKVISSWDIENINDEASRIEKEKIQLKADSAALAANYSEPLKSKKENKEMGYSEEELQARIKQEQERIAAEFAEKEQKVKAEAEITKQKEIQFSEAIDKAKGEMKAQMESQFAEERRIADEKIRKQEIANFIEVAMEKGKIYPAWAKMGIIKFMESLNPTGEIEFAENMKFDQFRWFKEFVEEVAKTHAIQFGEFASRGTDLKRMGNTAGEKLEALTQEKLNKTKTQGINMSYEIAFCEVQKENPIITKEYQFEERNRIN